MTDGTLFIEDEVIGRFLKLTKRLEDDLSQFRFARHSVDRQIRERVVDGTRCQHHVGINEMRCHRRNEPPSFV